MESLAELVRRLRGIAGRGRIESRLDEEIRFHLDQQTAKNIRAGMTPDEARRQAFLRFGGAERVKEQTRDEFRAAYVEDFFRDLQYGIRMLGRAPGLALVSVLTLALGTGAATAVFSVVNGVLLRPLPYPESDRIVRLFQVDSTGRRNNNVSEPNFDDWKAGTRSFRAMAEMAVGPSPVSAGGERVMAQWARVSREFFDVLGVAPIVGRHFVAEEQRVGGTPAALVSDRFWRLRLDAQPIDSLTVRVDERAHQVVGVMPPGFEYPGTAEIWTPRELSPPQTSRTAHNFQVVARLADGVSLGLARSDLSHLSRALKARYGDATWMSDAGILPLQEQLTAAARPVLLTLFAAAALLLVIACLNVSNLQLARASSRRRELAVRLAVGAGRGRLTRQLLAEALVLSLCAAVAGLAVAYAGVQALVALQPGNLPRIDSVQMDWWAMAFALGVAALTTIVLGLLTAVRASKHEMRETLTEGTRTVSGGRASERSRQALVVAQVALTIVLLAGAGLLARSFVALLAIDPGYRTERALLLDLMWPFPNDPSVHRRRLAVQQELLNGIQGMPGVENVGLVNVFPLGSPYFPNGQFLEMTRPDELQTAEDIKKLGDEVKARAGFAGYRIASEGYFSTMGIRLVRGRLFEPADGPDAPHVAVISESLAAAKWPNQDPLGRWVQFGNMDGDRRGFRIVGVVTDVREISPEALPGPIFYGYYQQRMAWWFTIVARTAEIDAVAPAIRQLVRRTDPELPIQIRRVEEAFDRALAGRRFSLTLIAVFSAAALILATLGIYGLISYLVAERTREIGIRLALGAAPSDVLRLVVGKGVMLAAAGTTIGLAAALGLTRLVKGMLFGITATDPIAFGGVVLVTLASVLLASYIPARRAVQVAPVEALRIG